MPPTTASRPMCSSYSLRPSANVSASGPADCTAAGSANPWRTAILRSSLITSWRASSLSLVPSEWRPAFSRLDLPSARQYPFRRLSNQAKYLPSKRSFFLGFGTKNSNGLADEPRPGAPRSITDAQVEAAVTRTLEARPAAATHWSTRALARELGLPQTAVSRIWRAFGLKPHLSETFTLSADPFFVEKVRDIVGLYLNPPERAIVLRVDEKSQVQALERTQPIQPALPGRPAKASPDYVRHGTTSLFAALDVATGRVIGRCRRRHRHQEFI